MFLDNSEIICVTEIILSQKLVQIHSRLKAFNMFFNVFNIQEAIFNVTMCLTLTNLINGRESEACI